MNFPVMFLVFTFWVALPISLLSFSLSINDDDFPELKNLNSFINQRNLANFLVFIFIFLLGVTAPLAISVNDAFLQYMSFIAASFIACVFMSTFVALYKNLKRLNGGSSKKFYVRSELSKLPRNLQVFNKDLILTNGSDTLSAGDVVAICKEGVLIPVIVDKGGKTATEVQYAIRHWSRLFPLFLYTEPKSPLMRFDLSKYNVLNTVPDLQDEFERLSDIK